MIIRKHFVTATRGMATRVPFRTRKPKLGIEPRTASAGAASPSALQAGSLSSPLPTAESSSTASHEPTHFAITLHRSAIGLPDNISRTLEALGIHRRMQTVYHRFSPDIAGKILQVKELVQVRNVPPSEVRTPEEARNLRKAVRGYEVISRARPSGEPSLHRALLVQQKEPLVTGSDQS